MLVAVSLFAIVMVVGIGSLLALAAANKKTQALQSVMNNLNISLDSMVRNLRMGSEFQCIGGTAQTTQAPMADCGGTGGTGILFACNPISPGCTGGNTRWGYKYVAAGTSPCGTSSGCIARTVNGTTWEAYTSSDVNIEAMHFYVLGTTPGRDDGVQPKVMIVVQGHAGGSSAREGTDFHIQATAVQRTLDL